METIIAILLWIGAIMPGSYTKSEFDFIRFSNQSEVTSVENDPVRLQQAQSTQNPSVVTILNIDEAD